MGQRPEQTPQSRRSVREWVADVIFFIVLVGVIAAIFYLGFLPW